MDKVIAGNGVRKTAREVARALGKKLLRKDTNYNIAGKYILNWGKGDLTNIPGYTGANIINKPEAVLLASSKIRSLEALGTTYAIECTTDIDVAKQWLRGGFMAVGRDLDNGSGGRGITVYKNYNISRPQVGIELIDPDSLPSHLFYTKYFPAKDEYRVHVGKNSEGVYTIIDCQRKSLRTDENRPDNPTFSIRNHEGGFIFERGADVPDDVKAVSMGAVEALGLDFGAVDIRRNNNEVVKVIEVNTAPGLSGTTLENYIHYFQNNWM